MNYKYTVIGRWPFPKDILRYDNAECVDEVSKESVEQLTAPELPEKLRGSTCCVILRSNKYPTVKRWESFGWSVGIIQENFDKTKPVKTKGGHAARIVVTDAKSDYPIVAMIMIVDGNHETAISYHENGRLNRDSESEMDLENVPAPPNEFYLNIYGDSISWHKTREDADEKVLGSRKACKHIFWSEGEYDD